MTSQEWKNTGKFVTVDDNKLFVIDTDPMATKKETIVILHGYPLTSFDFRQVINLLSEYYRVVTHDHLGFGFSDEPKNFSYSLVEDANVAIKLWNKLQINDFKIIAVEYGVMMAKEILFKKNAGLIPFKIKSIVASQNNSSKLYDNLKAIDYLFKNKHLPKYREVLANYDNKEYFNTQENGPHNVKYGEETKIRSIWDNFNSIEKQKEILQLSTYAEEIYLYWHRWMNGLKNTDIHISFFWRKDDFTNISDILLHMATFRKDNIEIIENKNCYVIDENPKNWTLMILEQLDHTIYYAAKQVYFVC